MSEAQLDLFALVPLRPEQEILTTADGLVPDDTGLLARPISRHSIEKAYMVGRFANTVSTAIRGKLPVYWVELFCGPGRLQVRETGEFVDGSPMQALAVRSPFSGYFFADLSDECVTCLRERTRGMQSVHVQHGDANSAEMLDMISRVVPDNALVIAYLDPEGLDLHIDTVRALAFRYRRLDLLINLPVNGLKRYLGAGNEERAVDVLGHDAPRELMNQGPRYLADNIRRYFASQLRGLGYRRPLHNPIRLAEKKAVLYDLVVAGRHDLTVELFERANEISVHGQRALQLM